MSNSVKLPNQYFQTDTEDPIIVSEGKKTVSITEATMHAQDRIKIKYKVIEGNERGSILSQYIDLDNVYGMRSLKELLEAVNVTPNDQGDLDLDDLLGKELGVTVVHKKSNGNTYANIKKQWALSH